MEHFTEIAGAGVSYLVCHPLATQSVPHGFTLRTHGFGARDRGDEDRDVLSRAVGLTTATYMRQVHGASVRVSRGNEGIVEADGLMTDTPGLGLVAHSADCVPLVFWAERARVVAAVHSGWRGTLARIASRTVAGLRAEFEVDPDELTVAVGPAIRACCYEVGPELVEAFRDSGRDLASITREGSRGVEHLDLIADNRNQLREVGVHESRIYDSGRCTFCDNESFYSYRKEGQGAGRVMAIVGIREEGASR